MSPIEASEPEKELPAYQKNNSRVRKKKEPTDEVAALVRISERIEQCIPKKITKCCTEPVEKPAPVSNNPPH